MTRPRPLINIGPVRALALVAVFQGYLTVKTVKLTAEYLWFGELGDCSCPHHMHSAPTEPAVRPGPLRLIKGGKAA
jgi:hypothetical protein